MNILNKFVKWNRTGHIMDPRSKMWGIKYSSINTVYIFIPPYWICVNTVGQEVFHCKVLKWQHIFSSHCLFKRMLIWFGKDKSPFPSLFILSAGMVSVHRTNPFLDNLVKINLYREPGIVSSALLYSTWPVWEQLLIPPPHC